jgi:hypothetical protein
MAITNAQQFKQLVNPPMEGKKRPGYRGDAAYGDKNEKGQTKDSFAAGDGFDRESFQAAQRMGEARQIAKNLAEDKAEELVERFRNKKFRGSNLPGFIGTALNLASPLVQRGITANRNFFLDKVLPSKNFKNIDFTTLTPSQQDALYSDYMSARLSGEIDAFGNPLNQGDDSSPPLFPRLGIMAQAPKEDEEPKYINPLSKISSRIAGSRFAAAGGGIASLEDMDREAFILGGVAKGLKKAVRGIKKIAKSPIGKAALIGGLAYFGGGGGLPKFLGGKGLGGFSAKTLFSSKNPLLFTDGKLSFAKTMGVSSILALLEGKTEEEKKDILKDYYESQELTPSTTIRQAGSEFDFYNYNLAEGGTPRKEPVAKKVMPLLDMGGMEKDYRAEGGFVPIGRMEKADDVPARLSKNEFVFTADAVRNAGDGDVDKGAEVMYNMMKNLEAGGDVSKESQGLEGARKMFQTSQRLEEVL